MDGNHCFEIFTPMISIIHFIAHIDVKYSSNYFQIYPSLPSDDDHPQVSFWGCQLPAASDCPTYCKNSGLWTYYYKTKHKDVSKSLSLSCNEGESYLYKNYSYGILLLHTSGLTFITF